MKILVTILIVTLAIFQGTYIFIDASKNKIPFKWIWGFLGLLSIPSNLIIYLIYKKNRLKKINKKK